MLGDFTLIMEKGDTFDKEIIAELYTRQLGMVIARKQAENALKANEEKYRLIFEHTPIGVLHFDNKGRITDCNNNFVKITGSSYQKLIGLNILDLPDKKLTATMREALQGKLSIYEGDYHSVTAQKITPVRVMFAPIPTRSNKFETGVGIVEDITERRKLENALIQEKMLIETTLISVGDGVISTNNSGHIVLMNKAAESLTGWLKEAAQGEAFANVFNVVDATTREKIALFAPSVFERKQNHESEDQTVLISKEGLERSIESNVAPIILENGEVIGLVVVFRDISDKKKKQEEIEFLSYHDQLTGIYNRRFFVEELKRLDTERNLPISIVMGDVNGLKLINDSFGHGVGDQLLIKVAEMIKRGCRADDIVARLGGDEFVILLPKTNTAETENVIKRINQHLGKEKIASLDISVSFGYETKISMDESIQETLKNTEDHMYRHKLSESSSMRSKTIDMIMKTLFEKNHRELLHSKRVSELCENIAIMLNYDKNDVNQIRIAGLMHDIGKIGIDEKILNKPLKLNQEEWNEVKRHSEIGYRILSSVNEFSEIADYVLEHHERWDGQGYPRGLKGEQISLKARIIAIADAYDAMTCERTYSKVFSKDEAIIEIIKCSGSQFDPDIARIFVDVILGEQE
jgi:diguanylate cyclase (GGDEF)-like protein/PAS domain S-box-containing protein/putative nucleotidyltransferase with HDIG domain